MKDTVIVSDMGLCQPAASMSHEVKKGCWRLVDYETENGLKGAMAFGVPDDSPGEITLPLQEEGRYRIFLGMNYNKNPYRDNSSYGHIRVKLTSDASYTRFTNEADFNKSPGKKSQKTVGNARHIYNAIHEVYWKTAEIRDQAIHFKPMGSPYDDQYGPVIANISYVKLEPVGEEDSAFYDSLEDLEGKRNIGVMFCTGALTGHTSGQPMYHPVEREWFAEEIEPYKNSDVGIFSFEGIRGGVCQFKTKLGDIGLEDGAEWPSEWVDPLQSFTQLAHGNGMKAFLSMRMIGQVGPIIIHPVTRGRYYFKMRRFAKCDADGIPCSTLSIAYPEVRQFWLGLLREALEYDIDGITVYFHRGIPYVLYEKPSVDAFIEKYGVDPRPLGEDDPRWQEHVAGYVTQYLREIRELVDEKPGRELAVLHKGISLKGRADQQVASVLVDEASGALLDAVKGVVQKKTDHYVDGEAQLRSTIKNIMQDVSRDLFDDIFESKTAHSENLSDYEGYISDGFDVETWIKEGLINYLMPDQGTDLSFIKLWRKLGGNKLHIWPSLMPRRQSGQSYIRQAETFYEAGADGFIVWDSERRHPNVSEWNILKYLGHNEEFDILRRLAEETFKTVPLRIVRGMTTVHSFRDG